ncbi:hypothetical protein [Streptomyces sp. NPDC000888]
MAEGSEKKRSMHIEIDIPSVTANTRLGDLTVAQYVDLLTQVSDQLAAKRMAHSSIIAKKVMAQLRERVPASVEKQLRTIEDDMTIIQEAIAEATIEESD